MDGWRPVAADFPCLALTILFVVTVDWCELEDAAEIGGARGLGLLQIGVPKPLASNGPNIVYPFRSNKTIICQSIHLGLDDLLKFGKHTFRAGDQPSAQVDVRVECCENEDILPLGSPTAATIFKCLPVRKDANIKGPIRDDVIVHSDVLNKGGSWESII